MHRGEFQSFNNSFKKGFFLLVYVSTWILIKIEWLFLFNIKKNEPLSKMTSRQLSLFSGNAPTLYALFLLHSLTLAPTITKLQYKLESRPIDSLHALSQLTSHYRSLPYAPSYRPSQTPLL